MKKIVCFSIILMALMGTACTDTGIENKGFDEIDIFKIVQHFEIESLLPQIQNVKTDRGKLGLRGEVKSMEYSESDWEYCYLFDENGRFSEIRSNLKGYKPHIQRFVYQSKKGRLQHIDVEYFSSIYSDGKLTEEKRTYTDLFEYDEKGRLKEAEYDQNGVLLKYNSVDYNPDGSIAAISGDLSYGKHFHYDDNGLCMKLTYQEPPDHNDDVLDFVIEYTYNSNRDIETTKYVVTTTPPPYAVKEKPTTNSYTIKNTYEYDNYGNWIKKTSVRDQKGTPDIQIRKIEYY